jgi:2-polyprenyl-3-methyl-5-hydroxy-6-metoxy-1,4-benzoquinol methylase
MSSNEGRRIDSALVTVRKKCCICEIGELVTYRSFLDFPVFMGTTKQNLLSDLTSDQVWGRCENCGCLQLLELLPLDVLYTEDHASGSVGEIWMKHHKDFAMFISKDNPSQILEIGAAHGILAHNILNINPRVDYTIVEPSPTAIPGQVKLIQDYIENRYELVNESDVIVHSHLIEHLYEPVEFLRSISRHSRKNTLMYISFPNIEQLIKTGGTNSLNFEHTYYLHPSQFLPLLEQNGFKVEEFIEFEKHSFFVKCRKHDEKKKLIDIPNIAYLISDFDFLFDHLQLLVHRVNQLQIEENNEVFLFGAHIFSQSLLALGLDERRLTGVLDNALSKQGDRLYGTNLFVYSPTVLSEMYQPTVILKASHYQNEIKNQLFAINPNVKIIE